MFLKNQTLANLSIECLVSSKRDKSLKILSKKAVSFGTDSFAVKAFLKETFSLYLYRK